MLTRKQVRWNWLVLIVFLLMLGELPWARSRSSFDSHTEAESQVSVPAISTRGFRGIAYSPFREGQSPEQGIYPTLTEVRQDMPLLKMLSNGIHIYGCQHSEAVITATREISLPLTLGAWLSGNPGEDSAEIACATNQAQANPHIISIVAGNESVLFSRLTVTEVCTYAQQARDATDLPVTTAEPWHIWIDNPDLAACVDYLLVHIHPYWECQPIENALAFIQEKFAQVSTRYPDQTIVIGETGWPSAGTGREDHCGAMPTPDPDQQTLFAADFLDWAVQEGVDFYYFEAFDEPWKCEGGRAKVECHWGIYDTNRVPKPAQWWFIPHRLWLPLVLRSQP